jgi:hypothetical protein
MEAAIDPDENGRVKRDNKEVIKRTRNEVKRIALVVGIVELVKCSLL